MGMDAEQLFFAGLAGRSSGKMWFLRASGREPFCLYQYQMVLQLEATKHGYFGKGTMRLTFNYYSKEKQTKEVLQVSLVPPLSKLFPGMRFPYLMTSMEPLGEIYSIYYSWAPVLDGPVYPQPAIFLKYIRITPVEALFGKNKLPMTKYFCKQRHGRDLSHGIRPFETVLLDATLGC